MSRFLLYILILVFGAFFTPEAEAVFMAKRTNEWAYVPLCDGFDFPVGKPNADGYYRSRGLRLVSKAEAARFHSEKIGTE